MSEHPVLNVGEITRLGMVMEAAERKSKVFRFYEDGNMVVEGTARHIVRDAGFNFATQQSDVRDCFLRVTLDSGFDVIWPVQDLADGIGNGTFAVSPSA